MLLAVDLAADSLLVGERARTLALALSAELEIVHVIEPVPVLAAIPPSPVGPGVVTAQAELIATAEVQMGSLAKTIGVPETHLHLVTGSTKSEIVRVAVDRRADLIVIGNRERHGLAFLLKPTEDVVVHQAPCDVLAIRLHEADTYSNSRLLHPVRSDAETT
jgi:universal stress protein A